MTPTWSLERSTMRLGEVKDEAFPWNTFTFQSARQPVMFTHILCKYIRDILYMCTCRRLKTTHILLFHHLLVSYILLIRIKDSQVEIGGEIETVHRWLYLINIKITWATVSYQIVLFLNVSYMPNILNIIRMNGFCFFYLMHST